MQIVGSMSAVAILWPIILFLTYSEDAPNTPHANMFAYPNINALFRFSLLFCCLLWLTGAAMQVFKAYRINYIYIFEIEPANMLTFVQVYRMASFCTFVYKLCEFI